jgi:hypothetical protein
MDRHTSTGETIEKTKQREWQWKRNAVKVEEVRVHLSRLWTDTHVRNLGRECSRLAPVEGTSNKQSFRAVFLELSE